MALSSYVRFLISPGRYHICLACHLDERWKISLQEEGFSVEWLSAASDRVLPVSGEVVGSILLVHVQDQGELLAILTYLYNLGIPLLSVQYAGAASIPDLLSDA
jgi:hypothetical protein